VIALHVVWEIEWMGTKMGKLICLCHVIRIETNFNELELSKTAGEKEENKRYRLNLSVTSLMSDMTAQLSY
jgi:fructose-1,6-bisphosphatase